MHDPPAVPPAARRDARGGHAARADGDRLAGGVGPVTMVVGDVDRPAAGGLRAAGGDVASERDQHASPDRLMRRPGGAVGGQRLGGRPEVELHASGQRDPRRVPGHLDLLPALAPAPVDGDPGSISQRRAGRHRDQLVPVSVVAEGGELRGERRIHGAARGVSGVDGKADGLGEQRAGEDRARAGTGHRVEAAQLGVGAKAAGGRVDGIKFALHGRPRRRVDGAVVAQHGGSAEGVPRLRADERRRRRGRCRFHHEPPETVGAGAGAGWGAGAGAAEVVVTCGAVAVAVVGAWAGGRSAGRLWWRAWWAPRCRASALEGRAGAGVRAGDAVAIARRLWPGNAWAVTSVRSPVAATARADQHPVDDPQTAKPGVAACVRRRSEGAAHVHDSVQIR